MMAVGIGLDPALNLGNLGAASSGFDAAPAAGASTTAAHSSQRSFHSLLRDAGRPPAQAGSVGAPRNGDTPPGTEGAEIDGPAGQPPEAVGPPVQLPLEGEPACDALAQLIQSLIPSTGRLSEPPEIPLPEEQPEAETDGDDDGFLHFVDLLKQLQTPRTAGPAESDEISGRQGGCLNSGLAAAAAGQKGEDVVGALKTPQPAHDATPAESGDPSARLQEISNQAPAGTDAGENDEGFLRVVDLLKQLRTSAGATPAETREVLAQLREILTQAAAGGEERKAGGLPGRIHQWLAQAHDALPGIPWGRVAQLITGQGAAAGAASASPLMSEAGPLQTGAASREDLLHPDLPGLLREALGKSKPESAGKRETASRPTAPAPVAAEHETPTAPARAAARVQEMPLPAEGLRPSTLEATAPPAIMAEEGSEEGLSAALLRDGRTAPTPETASDRSAGAGVALKPREADGAAVKGDVIEQIVQRAAVHLKSDQGEARIDLKPEFLGQVRMQIVTENQQVTVRILTESPMVRDLIEQNLHQLKSDLQQQGLQVERVDVSVADNPRRDAGRQDRAGGRRNGRGPSEVDVPAIGSVEERVQALAGYWGAGGRNTINMFV